MPRNVTSQVRRGFTLVELLVTLVIFGIVGGAVMSLLTNQQRFYRDTNERIGVRRELRGGAATLPMEIRPISSSPASPDVHDMLDSAFYFNANYGSAIVCEAGIGYIDIPPKSLVKKLAGWYTEPIAGDTVAIFDEGPKDGSADDAWLKYEIADVELETPSSEVCAAHEFLASSGETTELGLRLHLVMAPTTLTTLDPLPATVVPGAVVRLLRAVRYSIFQPTPDPAKPWYLGYAEYDQSKGGWNQAAVVGGPFRAFDGSELDSAGVQFRYYDDAGTLLTSVAQSSDLARVDVVLRAEAGARSALSGGVMRDSVLFRVALRNRQ